MAIDAETMREWRKQHGLTQQEAAELIGLSRQAWQNYELGGRDVPAPVENLLFLIDRYPYIRRALVELTRVRYAGEPVIKLDKPPAEKPAKRRKRARTPATAFVWAEKL